MPELTRWLIAAPGDLPEPLFLHVFDDGEAEVALDYAADRTRALRFASYWDAVRFAREHRVEAATIIEYAAADLVGAPHHVSDRLAAVY